MRAGGAKVASVVSSRLWLSTIASGFSTANNRCRISLGLEITGYHKLLLSMAQRNGGGLWLSTVVFRIFLNE
jgi:hypothetical protein